MINPARIFFQSVHFVILKKGNILPFSVQNVDGHYNCCTIVQELSAVVIVVIIYVQIWFTHSVLGSLVEVYVEQMKISMPQVENAVDTMAQIENKKAREEAVAFYSSNMHQSLKMPVLDDSEFSRCHNDCLQLAIKLFLSKSVFDSDQAYPKRMNVSLN